MAFDPDQPRDSLGRWTDSGGTAEAIRSAASDVSFRVTNEPLHAENPEIVKASMEKWFNEDLPKLEEGIDMRNSVTKYTTPFFQELNSNLYNDRELTPEQQEAYKNLRQVFDIAPKIEGYVYRGMKFSDEQKYKAFKRDLGEDGEIQFKGFVSTSLNKEVTQRAKFQGDPSIRFSAEMKIRGKNGVYISSVSTEPDEDEVLFINGTKVKIRSMQEKIDANNKVKLIIEGDEL